MTDEEHKSKVVPRLPQDDPERSRRVESQKSNLDVGRSPESSRDKRMSDVDDNQTKLRPVEKQPDARRSTLDDLHTKCDEYLNGWKRALADYENLQKSIVQNRKTDHRRIVVDLAESLLPVIDNFGYVLKHVPDVSTMSPELRKSFVTWFKGIEHIDRQFSDALKVLGVAPIVALGQKFDPHLHESGGSRQAVGQEPGTVVEELIKGWKVDDVVLRPTKVIVNEQ